MTFHWLIPLFAASATLALGILVFRRRRGTPVGRVFAFLSLMLVLWNLNFVVLYAVVDTDLAFRLTRIFRIGGLFVPVGILHLSVVMGKGRSHAWKMVLAVDYAASVLLALANQFDLIVSSLRPFDWGYNSVSGPFYSGYTLSVIVNFTLAIWLPVHDYRTTKEPRIRVQSEFWLLALAVALPLGLTNLLPAYGIPVYPLGSLGNAVWAGVVAYAIVRHRLMDVELIVSKGVAYIVTTLAVITPAFASSLFMQARIFGHVHYDFSFALLVMFFGIGALFPSLRARTEARIERSFFREKYEYRAALLAFAKTIVQILHREVLVRELCKALAETLAPDRVAIFLRDDAHGKYDEQHAIGPASDTRALSEDHPFIQYLEQRSEPVLRDEINSLDDVGQRSEVAAVITANSWEVCVPLPVSQRLIGFIGLGRKRNLDTFSLVDLDLLGTLAAQAAISFENARLYEELHRSRDIIQRAGRMSALGTLAAGIAHEIRNPLVSVQTFFQLAPQRLHDEEFVTSFSQLAESEVKRIADLVTELLTFARSHAESVQEVDLDDATNRVIRLLAPQAHNQRVKLERAESNPLPSVRVDPDRVKQVLINIVLNAIQATGVGGTVTVATRVVPRNGTQFCQIEVRDTGPGIPPEIQEDIFNPFFTTKDKGTGLGLSIAHQIITEHRGFISVESREGEGSRFFIHLPIPSKAAEPDDISEIARSPKRVASG